MPLRMSDCSELSSCSGPVGHLRSPPCPTVPGRLASLRTRDLTLGDTYKKTRRTFEPNVHAVRKRKDELKGQNNTHPKQRTGREGKRKEKKGVKREKRQTFQSHSIFEQGPADYTCRTGVRGRVQCESRTSPVCDPLKEEPDEDVDAILRKLYRDDFIDDLALVNSAKLKPIQLPLSDSPTLSTTSHGGASGLKMEMYEPEQLSLVKLFHELRMSDREEFLFMQLPDCMPAIALGAKTLVTVSPAAPRPASKDSMPQRKKSTTLQPQDSVLSQFPEGCLGKLQIRRSGKALLKLGDISMDVTEGAAFSFLQQLVSMRLSDGRSGDMMVLGNVSHKLVLSPDFQALLDQPGTISH